MYLESLLTVHSTSTSNFMILSHVYPSGNDCFTQSGMSLGYLVKYSVDSVRSVFFYTTEHITEAYLGRDTRSIQKHIQHTKKLKPLGHSIIFLLILISNFCVTVEVAKGHHSPNARFWLVEFCFFYLYTAKYQGILAQTRKRLVNICNPSSRRDVFLLERFFSNVSCTS